MVVLGPAGIGKSRLAARAAGALRDRATVLTGRCLPYGEGITYWPLGEIVRQLAGGPTCTRRWWRPSEGPRAAWSPTACCRPPASKRSTSPREDLTRAVTELFESLARRGPWCWCSRTSTGPSRRCSTWWSTC